MGQCQPDSAGTSGDEHVAVLDWDLDRAGPDYEVEDEKEREWGQEEEEKGEEREVEVCH